MLIWRDTVSREETGSWKVTELKFQVKGLSEVKDLEDYML